MASNCMVQNQPPPGFVSPSAAPQASSPAAHLNEAFSTYPLLVQHGWTGCQDEMYDGFMCSKMHCFLIRSATHPTTLTAFL